MEVRVGYVNVFVKDFERAVAFYRDTLGLPLHFADADHGYASFGTRGAAFSLAREGADAQAGRFTGVGLVVEDIDAVYVAWRAKGVNFTMAPTWQPWGGTLALFEDSEGNLLYLDPGHSD